MFIRESLIFCIPKGCWNNSFTLPETNQNASENRPFDPKGRDSSTPTIHFQGRFVSFRECKYSTSEAGYSPRCIDDSLYNISFVSFRECNDLWLVPTVVLEISVVQFSRFRCSEWQWGDELCSLVHWWQGQGVGHVVLQDGVPTGDDENHVPIT